MSTAVTTLRCMAAALVGLASVAHARDDEAYRQGVEWLLTRQRQDGSFGPKHERSLDDPDNSRHALFVVSWALLTSLGSSDVAR